MKIAIHIAQFYAKSTILCAFDFTFCVFFSLNDVERLRARDYNILFTH